MIEYNQDYYEAGINAPKSWQYGVHEWTVACKAAGIYDIPCSKTSSKLLHQLPKRVDGERPRTYVDSGVQIVVPPRYPVTGYIYDEDGVAMRTERDSEGRPLYPCVPPGYGEPVWSEVDVQWYSVKLSARYKSPRNTVQLYSPNGNLLVIGKEVQEQVVRQQRGKCAVTGRKFRKGNSAALMRLDIKLPAELTNLVAVESWMLEGTEPITFNLLKQQWDARQDGRKGGNVTSTTRNLPY